MRTCLSLMLCITLLLTACQKESIEPFYGSPEANLVGITSVAISILGESAGIELFKTVFIPSGSPYSRDSVLNDDVVRELRLAKFRWDKDVGAYTAEVSPKFRAQNRRYWFIGAYDYGSTRYNTVAMFELGNPFGKKLLFSFL